MTPKQKSRAIAVVAITVVAFLSIGFLVIAGQEKLNYYYSPDEVYAGKAPLDKKIRVGGLVEFGSLKKSDQTLEVLFDVVDGTQQPITIKYDGILPDLFREGQGIIAEGHLQADNSFVADSILAKHDEQYMPPEVADALERTGHVSAE